MFSLSQNEFDTMQKLPKSKDLNVVKPEDWV